jgi:hypothetical protein
LSIEDIGGSRSLSLLKQSYARESGTHQGARGFNPLKENEIYVAFRPGAMLFLKV